MVKITFEDIFVDVYFKKTVSDNTTYRGVGLTACESVKVYRWLRKHTGNKRVVWDGRGFMPCVNPHKFALGANESSIADQSPDKREYPDNKDGSGVEKYRPHWNNHGCVKPLFKLAAHTQANSANFLMNNTMYNNIISAMVQYAKNEFRRYNGELIKNEQGNFFFVVDEIPFLATPVPPV